MRHEAVDPLALEPEVEAEAVKVRRAWTRRDRLKRLPSVPTERRRNPNFVHPFPTCVTFTDLCTFTEGQLLE